MIVYKLLNLMIRLDVIFTMVCLFILKFQIYSIYHVLRESLIIPDSTYTSFNHFF